MLKKFLNKADMLGMLKKRLFLMFFLLCLPFYSLASLDRCLQAIGELNLQSVSGLYTGIWDDFVPATAFVPATRFGKAGFYTFNRFGHKFCKVKEGRSNSASVERNLVVVFHESRENLIAGKSKARVHLSYKLNGSGNNLPSIKVSSKNLNDEKVKWETIKCNDAQDDDSKVDLKRFLEVEIQQLPSIVLSAKKIRSIQHNRLKAEKSFLASETEINRPVSDPTVDNEMGNSAREDILKAFDKCAAVTD